jgi:hypothetical protein
MLQKPLLEGEEELPFLLELRPRDSPGSPAFPAKGGRKHPGDPCVSLDVEVDLVPEALPGPVCPMQPDHGFGEALGHIRPEGAALASNGDVMFSEGNGHDQAPVADAAGVV